MIKYKLKYANYNENTGKSTVAIATNLGIIRASAQLHPDDRDYSSHYFGCEIAESRCVQKYYKKLIQNLKRELLTLGHLEKIYLNLKGFNSKSREFCELRKEIHNIEKKINKYQDLINKITKNIDTICKEREKRLKKIQSRKDKNN